MLGRLRLRISSQSTERSDRGSATARNQDLCANENSRFAKLRLPELQPFRQLVLLQQ
jgi:hypothetical protein